MYEQLVFIPLKNGAILLDDSFKVIYGTDTVPNHACIISDWADKSIRFVFLTDKPLFSYTVEETNQILKCAAEMYPEIGIAMAHEVKELCNGAGCPINGDSWVTEWENGHLVRTHALPEKLYTRPTIIRYAPEEGYPIQDLS